MSNCITDSKSNALDVRVLKVAEWCFETAADREKMRMTTPDVFIRFGNLLREIAADIRAIQADPRASMDPVDHADLIVMELRQAQRVSVSDVDAAWRWNMGHILHLSDADRIRCIIAWIDASILAGMEGK